MLGRFVTAILGLIFVIDAYAILQITIPTLPDPDPLPLPNGESFDAINYDIYRGDVNGDGKDDLYFRGKPKVVLIGYKTFIPILNGAHPSFVYYREDSIYMSAELRELNESQLANLTLLSDDELTIADFDGDGVFDVVIFPQSGEGFFNVRSGNNGQPKNTVSNSLVETVQIVSTDGSYSLPIPGAAEISAGPPVNVAVIELEYFDIDKETSADPSILPFRLITRVIPPAEVEPMIDFVNKLPGRYMYSINYGLSTLGKFVVDVVPPSPIPPQAVPLPSSSPPTLPLPSNLVEAPGLFERVPTPAAPKFFVAQGEFTAEGFQGAVAEIQNFPQISSDPAVFTTLPDQFGTYLVTWEPVQSPVLRYELKEDRHDGNGFVTVQNILSTSFFVKRSFLRADEVVATGNPTFASPLPNFFPALDYSTTLASGLRSYRVRSCDQYGCGEYSPQVQLTVVTLISKGVDDSCVQNHQFIAGLEADRATNSERRELFRLCQQKFQTAALGDLEEVANVLLEEQRRLIEEVFKPNEERINNGLNAIRQEFE